MNRGFTIFFAIAAVTVLLLLSLPQIRFDWAYHNDEPTKVTQILDGIWNLRHPPLMMGAVSIIGKWTGQQDPQQIVYYGRLLSVFSAALVLVCAVWIASLRAGILGAAGVAAVLLFYPMLFEVAHYFKEDSLFLAGMMAVLLVLFFCERSKRGWPEILLAVSLVLVVSSKYIGWILVPLTLLFLWCNRRKYVEKNGTILWLAVLLFLILVVAINFPLIADWQGFRESFGDEIYRLGKGDYGMRAAHLLLFDYLALLRVQVPAVLLAGYLGYLAYRLLRFRSIHAAEWIFLSLPLFALLFLGFTAKYSERYILPISILVCTAGVYGPLSAIGELARGRYNLAKSLKLLVAVMLVLGSLLVTRVEWLKIYRGFQHDSRAELTQWICRNLADDAFLAEDTYAKINPYGLQGRVLIDNFFAADIGSVEELKTMGVTHVIISYDVYHRFVDGGTVPPRNQKEDFERRKLFYETLRGSGKILWQDDNANPKALHPGLMLIKL